MSKELIKVPDIGGAEGVEVIEICVAVGDRVEKEQSLVVLESDKASMEVPSPVAGTVTAIDIADALSEGDVILTLETGAVLEESNVGAVAAAQTKIPEPAAAKPETIELKVAETAKDIPPAIESVGELASAHLSSPGPSAAVIETINVPDMGDVESVDVIELCVNIGDWVDEGDSLIVLETDKASMEVPSPMAGTVISLAVHEGAVVSTGTEILQLELANKPAIANSTEKNTLEQAAPAEESQPAAKGHSLSSAQPVAVIQPDSSAQLNSVPSDVIKTAIRVQGDYVSNDSAYAGPSVRRLAREIGLDITLVKGTGPRGRVIKDDLKGYIKKVLTEVPVAATTSGIPAVPDIDFSKFGDVRHESLSKIDRLTAQNMQRSWLNVPHVTQFDDANISDLEDFRQSLKKEAEQRGVKITPLPFLIKACALALRENPKFNASLHSDGQNMIYKEYVNIGMAVDTPVGLVVPVIKDVDKKSIWDLAAETAELAQKAKDRKLTVNEMQGGCFTISSLGAIGGQGFTPIVNAPELAILGVSKLSVKPLWNGSEFIPAKMLPLSLSYDHRAINGGDAGRFLTYLTTLLADVRRLAL